MDYEWIGYFAMIAAVVALIGGVLASRLSPRVKLLLICALLLRIFGGWLRYYLLFEFYGGSGDAVGYFGRGIEYAERIADLDFGMITNPHEWFRGKWWGTHFLSVAAGFTVLLIGPTLRGEFLLFGLLSLLGLVLFGFKVWRGYPEVKAERYLFWMLLWPSLWYWPSSLGKDSLVLMGVCIYAVGFVGAYGKMKWIPMLLGLCLVSAIRPQVTAVLLASTIIAQWLVAADEWTPARILQGVLLLAVGGGAILGSLSMLGIEDYTEGVQDYMSAKTSNLGGGSEIESPTVGVLSAPLGLINVLFRPFPWEAHNVPALASSVELVLLWGLVWYYRRSVAEALRNWRKYRLLAFSITFTVMYAALLGLAASNLGLIARQRIFVFPFLFLLIAWREGRPRIPHDVTPARVSLHE